LDSVTDPDCKWGRAVNRIRALNKEIQYLTINAVVLSKHDLEE